MPSEPRDERDDLIDQQQQEITRLREDLARVERQRREIERDRDRWQRRHEQVKKQLDAARRAGFRQAAPFAKAHPQGHGGRPGRRAGEAYGRRGHRPRPRHVDDTYTAPLPDACPACGGPIDAVRVTAQYQEDLPIVRPLVRQFDVHIGECRCCGRRVQGRHPLQTSDALGAAQVHLGPGAVTFVVLLHTHFGVPLAKVAAVLREQFGLHVTAGGLAHVLHRAARQAAPTYAALCDHVRGSPMVTPDETGWRVGAVLHWLWAFATPDTTVYAIRPGRSFEDAVTILDPQYDGVLIRDGWAPYRHYVHAIHQTCLEHLIRRCRTIQQDHPRSPWAGAVEQVLRDGLALRDRRDAHALSDHGLAVARGQLLARLTTLIDAVPALTTARRFAAHLTTELPAVFAFLWAPGIDATNWRAEQAIRPAVVMRKVSGGNRTRHGADTQEILTSVVHTVRHRHLDLAEMLTTMLQAREPIVPIPLSTRPQ